MGSLPKENRYLPTSHHLNILESVLDGSVSASDAIIRSYKHSFNGFAAKLTEIEKEKLKSSKDVVSVFPDGKLKIQTTRSWDFTGLTETVKRNKVVESDIIIGLLDTGIWPESESFSDEGFGPVPKKWKGQCADSFPCNKKIIGATTFLTSGDNNPRDLEGHGTHTASTAAGGSVQGASFYGIAEGTARGAVPSSRIAAYQICDDNGCSDSSVLAGFDTAIKDGVDIISISVGAEDSSDFDSDTIAIGAFHAMEKGILTVHSAGNNGDNLGMTSSVAPWLFSVAASSIDRDILSNTQLGNGKTLTGFAINSATLKSGNHPLVYGKDASSSCTDFEASVCTGRCLDSELVNGKIVLCDESRGIEAALDAGAIGAIVKSSMTNISFVNALPSSALRPEDYNAVKSYYHSSKSPEGNIQKTVVVNDTGAPIVAAFSSRGPNKIASDILKPDISAPGIDILAAYSPKGSPSSSPLDKRSVNYTIISGTSMACPHVAGASAYVKSFHPTWSPSAIKSALMTTAQVMSPGNNPEAEFAYGAGHIDPVKASNPGLVYESKNDDYINFLCKLGYDASKIKLIAGRSIACKNNSTETTSPVDLNYPSLSAKLGSSDKDFSITFQRSVTNVGNASSTYKATVARNPKFKVSVEPSALSFKSLNESLSFSVTVDGGGIESGGIESSSLTWSDGVYTVRSPIVIYLKLDLVEWSVKLLENMTQKCGLSVKA
ncbi:hypothetical protein V2J09_018149 [Rumex salicifolius]